MSCLISAIAVASSMSARLRAIACTNTSPTILIRAMRSSGQTRAARNAPKASAPITRPPTLRGIVRFERMPIRRTYSTSATASAGRSSGSDGIRTTRSARSSPAYQVNSLPNAVPTGTSSTPGNCDRAERDHRAVRGEFEERAAVEPEKRDELAQGAFDLGLHAIARNVREADGEIGEQALERQSFGKRRIGRGCRTGFRRDPKLLLHAASPSGVTPAAFRRSAEIVRAAAS